MTPPVVNDTMIRYSPETGYPITQVRRRGRVQARPGMAMPREPWPRRVLRWLLNGAAGAFILAAVAWLMLGVAGHLRAWMSANDAGAAVAALEQAWADDAPATGTSGEATPLPPSAAPDFAPASGPIPGQVWGKLHVPSLGLSDVPLYQGTESEQINVGVGHYTGTEFPWQPGGNMGLAGHRTGWGQLFNQLDVLRPGDIVHVETREAFFEYTVTGSAGVEPTDTWVLADLPGPMSGTNGASQLVTLTTCDGPNNEMRHVVWGQMTGVHDKTTGSVPAAVA